MSNIPIINRDGTSYQICLTDSFELLPAYLKETQINPDKIGIVADTHTGPLYGEQVLKIVREICQESLLITIEAGETYKNLDTITGIYDAMVENRFTRKSLLISLGGGVVGDMTGFAAATYMRGIAFIQIPTTLLSQVDASIGGKTGFDYHGFKNMIGAFHMPSLVYINVNTLKTLPAREFQSGMAEIIKSALIKDEVFYEWLKNASLKLNDGNPELISEMIFRTCRIKQQVVESDPFEKGDRMLLNFGHTIGHAVEKAENFTRTHGECVGLGMIAASRISYLRGLISREAYEDIKSVCHKFNLATEIEGLQTEEILSNTKSDKKMQHRQIRFILLKDIGNAFVSGDVSDEEIIKGINAIKKENLNEK